MESALVGPLPRAGPLRVGPLAISVVRTGQGHQHARLAQAVVKDLLQQRIAVLLALRQEVQYESKDDAGHRFWTARYGRYAIRIDAN
jgi:hypothetical protein